MLEKRQFYIDGAWVAPLNPNDFDVIDPSSEDVCAVISLGGQADTDAAVAAAKQAGASDCLVKPFCASALKDRLAAILGEP